MRMRQIAIALGVFWCAAPIVALADTYVTIRMEVDDTNGNPVSSIPVGADFELKYFAQDVRMPPPDPSGVFAAYANIAYAAGLASVNGPVVPGPLFVYDHHSDSTSTPGLLDGLGGFTFTLSSLGQAEQLLLTVPFHATSAGALSIVPSFDPRPGHEVLVLGYDNPVLEQQIVFTSATVTIVPEPASGALAATGIAGLVWLRRRRLGGHLAGFCRFFY